MTSAMRFSPAAPVSLASPAVVSLALASLAAVSSGCSSSDPPAATDTGTADTGSETAADTGPEVRPDTGPIYPEFTCGPGPYLPIEISVRGQTVADAGKAPSGPVKITSTQCPEVAMTTDAEGYIVVKTTIDKPFSLRFEPPGTTQLPTRWAEQTVHAWSESPGFTVMEASAKAQLPAIDEGAILVDVGAAAVGACGSEGVVVKVKDHPEAVVRYHAASKPYGPDAALTATSTLGLVSIGGLAKGTKVQLEATHPTCDVVSAFEPGTVTLEAGTVARMALFVRDKVPVCGPAPWHLLGGSVTDRLTDGTAGPGLPGATVSFDACAGVTATTDKDGAWQVWISAGMPSFRTTTLAGYLPAVSNELAWTFDYATWGTALRKADTWKPLMPGWDDTKGYVGISIAAPTSGPCKDVNGVAITVNGVAGAKVVYVDGDPPAATTGTVTTKKGLAYVAGLTPGILPADTFTGAKTGCVYKQKYDIDSGRTKVVAGHYTSVNLYAEATK